jgi:hypothetical protein
MPLMRGYLLSKQFNDDINRDNPLGTGGVLLDAYAELMRMLWSGKKGYIVPIEFRRILGKCKEQFSTNEQQDAQEVLNELFDMLHEDGNRITKKPMVPPIEDAWKDNNTLPRISLEAWRRYMRRNQSVMASLSTGQIYNAVTCPVCNKTSSSFDTFNMLTCPIPSVSEIVFRVTLYRRSSRSNRSVVLGGGEKLKKDEGGDDDDEEGGEHDDNAKGEFYPPSQHLIAEQYAVTVPRMSDSGYLKLQLQNLCGINRERLTLCELVEDERGIAERPDVDAVYQQFFPCMELSDHDPSSKILGKNKSIMGTGEARTTSLVCYENTVNLKKTEFEFDEEEAMERIVAREVERDADNVLKRERSDVTEERRTRKLESWYAASFNRHFLLQYGSRDEGRVFDTDILVFTKSQSEKRWPENADDLNEKLVGLRLDYLDDKRVWLQASVTAVFEAEGALGDDSSEEEWSDGSAGGQNEGGRRRKRMRVRIHFDRLLAKWDREFGIEAFKSRRIMPLHTHSEPKNATFRLNLYHRCDGAEDQTLFGVQQFVTMQHEWSNCRAMAAVLVQLTRHVAEEGAEGGALKEAVDALLSADARFLAKMDVPAEWERVDVAADNKKLRKTMKEITKRLPFVVRIASNGNPMGGEGAGESNHNRYERGDDEEDEYRSGQEDTTEDERDEWERAGQGLQGGKSWAKESEEEELDYSLTRTVGNCLHPRLCIVVSWKGKVQGAKRGGSGVHSYAASQPGRSIQHTALTRPPFARRVGTSRPPFTSTRGARWRSGRRSGCWPRRRAGESKGGRAEEGARTGRAAAGGDSAAAASGTPAAAAAAGTPSH